MKTLIAALALTAAVPFAFSSEPVKGESHFASLDGARVHYTNYGAADAAVVFVHGWACDETVWSEQASALAAQNIRVLTIDLPGHGQSDKPETAYTMHLYARAIEAVMRDAKLPRAMLVGHSNGTPVVRQFLREFPERVSALGIVEGGLRPFVDAAAMEKFIAPMRGADYPKVAGGLIDRMTKPIADAALRERIKTTMLRTPQSVAVSEFENSAEPAVWKPDPINVPVLMILAKQPAWNDDYGQFVRGIIPHLDYQVWENVSHFIMMEKPREFNDALMKFMRTNLLLPELS